MTARAAGGWTGGQYSLVRALAALLSVPHFLLATWSTDPVVEVAAQACGVVFLLLLAVGFHTRTVAGTLALLDGARLIAAGGAAAPESAWIALMLLFAMVPPKPFGSVAARGRVDPRGEWRMPGGVMVAAAGGLVVSTGWFYVDALPGPWPLLVVLAWAVLAWPPALLRPRRARPDAGADADAATGTATVYYDGNCGMCHGAVRFLLAEDRSEPALRYAPLDSVSFRAALPEAERAELPDSIVVVDAQGKVRARAAAVLFLGATLGGWWRLLAGLGRLIPLPLLDRGYDALAGRRHRLVAKPDDACPLLPPELQQRFDLE